MQLPLRAHVNDVPCNVGIFDADGKLVCSSILRTDALEIVQRVNAYDRLKLHADELESCLAGEKLRSQVCPDPEYRRAEL